jgi:diguanylate cyclase (GGDEF)-like protein
MNQSVIVAFVDVDHLKAINDSHGHAAGDAVLLAVTDALRAQIRSYDLIFRYGGDEFVCAITGITTDDATRRLELVNPSLTADSPHASITVGLAELAAEESPTDVIARADAALYRERLPRQSHPVASAS